MCPRRSDLTQHRAYAQQHAYAQPRHDFMPRWAHMPRLRALALLLLSGRWLQSQQLQQIWRFAVTGCICFVCDFAVLVACVEMLGWHYLWAATCGFALGVVVNFVLSVYWVFDAQHLSHKARIFVPFVVLALCGLGLTNLTMFVGVDYLTLPYTLSKVLATAIAMVFNFISRKLLLERPRLLERSTL